ncbi:MAG: C40 family peptidase [Prevotella sp.]|nr:C40 family peptidase [Prevotella sp.]
MKQKIIFCILLMLLSSVDVTVAKGKKKKAKKIQRTETVYEEIDNFDFLYADGYDVNMNFASTDDILNKATSLLGARYRSGSKGPYTFDCSGFTSYVYGQSNISIGCSSRDQYARNIPIRREEMQPGDLVFFTSPHSGRNVGHVGIVIDYDPINDTFIFIHASSKNGVKISNSTDGNYTRRYIGVRRVAK